MELYSRLPQAPSSHVFHHLIVKVYGTRAQSSVRAIFCVRYLFFAPSFFHIGSILGRVNSQGKVASESINLACFSAPPDTVCDDDTFFYICLEGFIGLNDCHKHRLQRYLMQTLNFFSLFFVSDTCVSCISLSRFCLFLFERDNGKSCVLGTKR